MKNNLIKTTLVVTLFLSISATTYWLWTWQTWYKAINSVDTEANTEFSNPMDEFVIDNDHGHDLFIPTKTFDELLSVWNNTPVNVELITKKENFNSLTINPSITYYDASYAAQCEDSSWSNGVNDSQANYVTNKRYNIIEIDVPGDIEWYLNIRWQYNGDQLEENTYIYKQTEWGSSVGITELHGLYKDDNNSNITAPILDFDNDWIDDIEEFYIPDQFDNWQAVEEDRTAKTATKIKLFSGTNYIRIQSWDSTTWFSCESWIFWPNVASIAYQHTGTHEWFIWLSNE